MPDAYRNVAGRYDRLFENMNKGLRLAGLRMLRPARGMSILDVGCGTGTQLELYCRFGCNLYGIDLSPSMLDIARARLGDVAQLDLGDATNMPYDDSTFDVIISMLVLHEMPRQSRAGVLSEMKRVLKGGGRMLLTDYHPGPYRGFQGWKAKAIILLSELAAGRGHFMNYRQFLATRGLPALIAQNGLAVTKSSVLAGGTFVICLLANTKA